MEKTIIDYLLEHQETFGELPFGDVDSLVLSTIAYFQLEQGAIGRLAPDSDEFIALPVALTGIARDKLFGKSWLVSFRGNELLSALLASRRFMDLSCGLFVNELDPVQEKQFAAITFLLPDESAYVAYRGTDNTLVGWKEDFNLSFLVSTPGQVAAKAYLERVAHLGITKRIYTGGHSKGGNLAEYAALTCNDEAYARVRCIYNHDGPSFIEDVNARMDDPDFRRRLHKTVPVESIFGMLMEKRNDYRIVEARSALFSQHAPTNWLVSDTTFVAGAALSARTKIIDEAIVTWGMSFTPEQRKTFLDTVFDIFESTGLTNWADLQDDQVAYLRAMGQAAIQLDPTLRTQILLMASSIFGTLKDTAIGQIRNDQPTGNAPDAEHPNELPER